MESVRIEVKRPSGVDTNAHVDKAMFKRPIITHKPRSRRGKVSTNLPIKALMVP